MPVEMSVFLAFGGTLIMIFILGKALLIPLRFLLKMCINSMLGAIILITINTAAGGLGVYVPVNVATSVIVGVLGVPGTLMLLVFGSI